MSARKITTRSSNYRYHFAMYFHLEDADKNAYLRWFRQPRKPFHHVKNAYLTRPRVLQRQKRVSVQIRVLVLECREG